MSATTAFNESDHPRDEGGQFAPKDAPESEASLDDEETCSECGGELDGEGYCTDPGCSNAEGADDWADPMDSWDGVRSVPESDGYEIESIARMADQVASADVSAAGTDVRFKPGLVVQRAFFDRQGRVRVAIEDDRLETFDFRGDVSGSAVLYKGKVHDPGDLAVEAGARADDELAFLAAKEAPYRAGINGSRTPFKASEPFTHPVSGRTLAGEHADFTVDGGVRHVLDRGMDADEYRATSPDFREGDQVIVPA